MRLILSGTDTLLTSGSDHLLLLDDISSAATATPSLAEPALAVPSISERTTMTLGVD